MNDNNKLTLEQELQLIIYKNKIYKMQTKNIKRYLIYILKEMMIQDNLMKYYFKNFMK
uniref:Uncharacterized protein ycf18 n=1 Tax=Wrangelia sp. TaxID=2575620 RepID=A0A4D6X1F9_9FLOR|nr:gbilisome degradation protein [Wrangelia sp.]